MDILIGYIHRKHVSCSIYSATVLPKISSRTKVTMGTILDFLKQTHSRKLRNYCKKQALLKIICGIYSTTYAVHLTKSAANLDDVFASNLAAESGHFAVFLVLVREKREPVTNL